MSFSSRQRLRVVAPFAISLTLAVGTFVPALAMRGSATDHREAEQAARASIDEVRIIESSNAVARRAYEEFVVRVTTEFADPRLDVDDAIALRVEALSDRFQTTDSTDTTRPLGELTSLAALSGLIADEALIAHAHLTQDDASDHIGEYVEGAWPVVRDAGGWLGDDGDLSGASAYFDIAEITESSPDAVEQIGNALTESGLADLDAWLKTLSADTPPESPAGVGEIVQTMVDGGSRIDPVVDARFDAVLDTLDTERDAAADEAVRLSRFSAMLFVIAGAAALLLIALSAVTMRRALRRARLASVDHLTGLGNRHMLSDTTTGFLTDGRSTSHAVAIIDCDRFKMINDVYGHEVGDCFLVELARRLTSTAAQLAERYDARTTVVRLGGDEFLMSIHADRDIDLEVVRDALAAVRRQQCVLDDGTRVDVEFSVGTALGSYHADLADLMRRSDRSLYEDKARRTHGITERSAPEAPVRARS